MTREQSHPAVFQPLPAPRPPSPPIFQPLRTQPLSPSKSWHRRPLGRGLFDKTNRSSHSAPKHRSRLHRAASTELPTGRHTERLAPQKKDRRRRSVRGMSGTYEVYIQTFIIFAVSGTWFSTRAGLPADSVTRTGSALPVSSKHVRLPCPRAGRSPSPSGA